MTARYYHGGVPGLNVGDIIVSSPPRITDGCPICLARAKGQTLTVGEYRRFAASQGPKGASILKMLEGAPDNAPIDPPSRIQGVYITTDIDYATFYAARSGGDLYEVAPIGALQMSREDHFPSWIVSESRVIKILRRNVQLSRQERRYMTRKWEKADARAKASDVAKP